MSNFIALILLMTTLVLAIRSSNCPLNEKQLNKKIQLHQKKCLNKGFKSSVGCKSTDGKLGKKAIKKCRNMENVLKKCNFSCPVDGGWSDYGDWTSCSVDCGGGVQSRNRTCTNPAPAFGGVDCVGEAEESQECNNNPCPIKYQITHKTGTGRTDGGDNFGAYLFTLIGTAGETAEHDCPADRTKGVTAHCTFEDPADIGKLKGMRIKNKGDNTWVFVSMSVEIEGVLRGKWQGTRAVNDYKTVNINLGYIVYYRITHKTGTGKYDGGNKSGAYFFTLIGTAGETAEHDCPADRQMGVTAQCTFEDTADIGKLKGMRVKNKSDNTWVFVSMSIEIDGTLRGSWQGTSTVNDYKTVNINFV